jgi:hypothetical protein
MELDTELLERLAIILACLFGSGLVLGLAFMAYVVTRIRRINLPPGADTLTALRLTPLSVVVTLDLLDLGLDVLSAPLAWALLTRLGLGPLRGVSIAASLIPGTQAFPIMTAAWVMARVLRPDRARRIIERR